MSAWRDRVADPVMVLPINQLDVDVKGLSSRAFTGAQSPRAVSVLAGAARFRFRHASRRKASPPKKREAFSEASAVGNVTLVPRSRKATSKLLSAASNSLPSAASPGNMASSSAAQPSTSAPTSACAAPTPSMRASTPPSTNSVSPKPPMARSSELSSFPFLPTPPSA